MCHVLIHRLVTREPNATILLIVIVNYIFELERFRGRILCSVCTWNDPFGCPKV